MVGGLVGRVCSGSREAKASGSSTSLLEADATISASGVERRVAGVVGESDSAGLGGTSGVRAFSVLGEAIGSGVEVVDLAGVAEGLALAVAELGLGVVGLGVLWGIITPCTTGICEAGCVVGVCAVGAGWR